MNIEYEKDNKERIPFEHYLSEYTQKDPEEISFRTGFLWDAVSSSFTVSFFSHSYRVTWPEFTVSVAETVTEGPVWDPLEHLPAAKILLIRFLNEGSLVRPVGKYLTYREVPWGEVYYRQFNGRCMQRLAWGFANKQEKFNAAMERMPAVKIKAGDTAWQFEVFPGYTVQFILWAGDEEFPPSSQILFSDNFASAFHAEDLVVVCDVAISILKNL